MTARVNYLIGKSAGMVRFHHVHVEKPFKGTIEGAEPKFQIKVLLDKDEHSDLIDELFDLCYQVAEEEFGKKAASQIDSGKLPIPLLDGDEEFPDDPVFENKFYFNAKRPENFGVAGLCDLSTGVAIKNSHKAWKEGTVYSGCYGFIHGNFFTSTAGGNRVNAGFDLVIKMEDGEPTGNASAGFDDVFGDLMDEFEEADDIDAVLDEEDEDEEPVKPARKSRSKAKAKPQVEEPEEAEDEEDDDLLDELDEEPAKPARKSRTATAKNTKPRRGRAKSEPDEDEEPAKPRGRGRSKATATKGKASTRARRTTS